MRPHSFKCGKFPRAANLGCSLVASMRPHSFKCGKAKDVTVTLPSFARFNEAALFQVRKECKLFGVSARKKSFNEAALFQVRKGRGAHLI